MAVRYPYGNSGRKRVKARRLDIWYKVRQIPVNGYMICRLVCTARLSSAGGKADKPLEQQASLKAGGVALYLQTCASVNPSAAQLPREQHRIVYTR